MAARFIKESPAQSYKRKYKYLLFSLLGFIGISTTLFIFVIISFAKENPDANVTVVDSPEVEILIAARRIESGESLNETMFKTRNVLKDNLPINSILKGGESLLAGQYLTTAIMPGEVIRTSILSHNKPRYKADIPKGYRAVSIDVNRRTILSGQVSPGSRVDVLYFSKNEHGQDEITPLVRFAKVLSVGGNQKQKEKPMTQNAKTTVELLVEKNDSLKIELARKSGDLSLSLLGDEEQPIEEELVISVKDCELDNSCKSIKKIRNGKITSVNPETGLLETKYLNEDGEWVRE